MTSPGERWRTGKGSRWAGWRRNWSDTGLRACLKNIPVGLAAGRGGWLRCSSVTDFSRICSLLAPRHPPRRARYPFPSLFLKHALRNFFASTRGCACSCCVLAGCLLPMFFEASAATNISSDKLNEVRTNLVADTLIDLRGDVVCLAEEMHRLYQAP